MLILRTKHLKKYNLLKHSHIYIFILLFHILKNQDQSVAFNLHISEADVYIGKLYIKNI